MMVFFRLTHEAEMRQIATDLLFVFFIVMPP